MKLAFSPEDEAFRSELVAFIEENCPPEAYSTGDLRKTYAGMIDQFSRCLSASILARNKCVGVRRRPRCPRGQHIHTF